MKEVRWKRFSIVLYIIRMKYLEDIKLQIYKEGYSGGIVNSNWKGFISGIGVCWKQYNCQKFGLW